MSQQQSYTYKFASSSGHGTLRHSPQANKASIPVSETPSEQASLIKGAGTGAEETSAGRTSRPFHRPAESAQGPTTTVLGSKAAASLHCHSYSGLSTSDVSLSLVNSGSVARDHLASERTFLAYVRTSLAIASAGVALAQILTITEFYSDATPARHVSIRERRVEAWSRPIGATAVVIALLVLLIGVARYFAIQKALVGGQFPTSRLGIGLVSIPFGALIIATFGVLFHNRLSTLW